jgi:pyruvate dehydrogenase E2 component (dihydrolipoamide acetyltransferase)
MSLELKIEALTAAVIALTAKLESSNVSAPAPVAPAPTPVVQAAPAPVAAPVAAAPVMPAPPAFVAPAPAPVASGAPFSDGKGLIDYVMGAYKALGPQKGAQIQNVLTGMGYQNINDVKPEHYAALHTGVEALKG